MITIRGAITAENDEQSILKSTEELLSAVMEKNDINTEDVLSITFTATKDLTKVYPAVAARNMGLTNASLMCVQEMFVEESLKSCIRVMIVAESSKTMKQVTHVYLKGAAVLRPDIIQNNAAKDDNL